MSYTSVFGGATIYPSNVSYFYTDLSTQDVVLQWPLETVPSTNVAASIVDVNCTAAGRSVFLPAANLASQGQTILFNNVGTTTFTVRDTGGNTIMTVDSGLLWQVYVTDNTTINGAWQVLQYGVGVSSANAASLAGYGIKAISSTLNQSHPVTSFNSTYTAGSVDRAKVLVWTGGVGNLYLPSAATVGNDWFVILRNQGTGNITVDPAGTNLIDGALLKDIPPTNSCFIISDGTSFYTIGYGQNVNFAFNYTSISVAGSGNYTLSTAEQNKISYKFTGALTGNRFIIVPPTVQQYWVDNSTTGSYTLTVKTASGTGFAVPQNSRAILYCDGTNVVNASTASIPTPISIALGGTGATTANGALINLGGGATGIAVFQSSSQDTAQTAMDVYSTGQSDSNALAFAVSLG